MSYVSFKNVTKEYSVGNQVVKALNGVSFTVEKGQFVVVVGPSGSGKSTALNLIGGMDRVTSGKIVIANTDITSISKSKLTDYRREDVGFVFQFYNLIPNLNAYENVDVTHRLGREPLDVKEMLKNVGLENRMKHFPAEMSGGELQRVSIARAICKNPKLLLCDEPTGALDSENGKIILSVLYNMSKKFGKTVIVVTHNTAITPIADCVIKLKDGHVTEKTNNKKPLAIEEVVL